MSAVSWLLVALIVALLTGIAAYLLPVRRLNGEHPYEVDPLDAGEHAGRHRHPGEGSTVPLTDDWNNRL